MPLINLDRYHHTLVLSVNGVGKWMIDTTERTMTDMTDRCVFNLYNGSFDVLWDWVNNAQNKRTRVKPTEINTYFLYAEQEEIDGAKVKILRAVGDPTVKVYDTQGVYWIDDDDCVVWKPSFSEILSLFCTKIF